MVLKNILFNVSPTQSLIQCTGAHCLPPAWVDGRHMPPSQVVATAMFAANAPSPPPCLWNHATHRAFLSLSCSWTRSQISDLNNKLKLLIVYGDNTRCWQDGDMWPRVSLPSSRSPSPHSISVFSFNSFPPSSTSPQPSSLWPRLQCWYIASRCRLIEELGLMRAVRGSPSFSSLAPH